MRLCIILIWHESIKVKVVSGIKYKQRPGVTKGKPLRWAWNKNQMGHPSFRLVEVKLANVNPDFVYSSARTQTLMRGQFS